VRREEVVEGKRGIAIEERGRGVGGGDMGEAGGQGR